jgi:uncharacterized protein (TIGR02118 family)
MAGGSRTARSHRWCRSSSRATTTERRCGAERGAGLIKLFGLIPRRVDISNEQFHAHWATTHRELALRIRALRRYVQSHRVAGEIPGLPSAIYEGVAEVWLEDVPTAVALAEDPDYTDHAKLDEPNFSDVDRHAVIVAREHVLRNAGSIGKHEPGVKAIFLLRAADGFDLGGLPAGLMDDMGPSRAVLAIPVAESYADGDAPPYDAVLELSFDDRRAFERAWASAGAAFLDGLDAVINRPASCALLVEELRVI